MQYAFSTKQKQEASAMKTAIVYAYKFMNKPYISLPNAATRRQVLNRIIDKLLVAVCCVSIVAGIIFLISLA